MRSFLCKFSKELDFWVTTFEIYHIIFLFFYQQMQPPEVVCKKAALRNFAIFTGKHLCWSLFLIKLQAFKCFSMNIAKTSILRNICEWMLLYQSELFMFHYCNVVYFTIMNDVIFSLIFIFCVNRNLLIIHKIH